ncbi:MAG: hypothetical protein V1858_01790 [Candidatus Gottesmanbacteria bacterium]
MTEGQPLSFETRQLNVGKRLCVKLKNGLIVSLPSAIKKEEDMGDYEIKTLEALQTEEGLKYVLDALKNRPRFEVNLNIGTEDNKWLTTAGVKEVGGEIIFFLYHGAN